MIKNEIKNSASLGRENVDTFRRDLRADTATRASANAQSRSHLAGLLLSERHLLANPPLKASDWFRKGGDVRRQFGVPPKGNANFARVQHFIHHIAPDGMAGFVLANGSMSSNQSGEGDIRRKLLEADLADCVVALPGQLFYSTQIPVCLWFLGKNKHDGKRRDRRKQTLFSRRRRSLRDNDQVALSV